MVVVLANGLAVPLIDNISSRPIGFQSALDYVMLS